MHYLNFTEPVELVGMLKSNLNARYLNSHWTSGVGGNAKITTQMHDINSLTEPVELVGMLKSQQMHDILILTVSGVGGNAKITT
jgi:hypothetical protein